MDNKYRVFRYIGYCIEIILLFILQTTPYLLPEIGGGKPILLIPVALSIAYFEEEIPAMFFGLGCGAVIDLSSSDNIGFYTFSLTLVCFIISQIFRDYMVVNFLNSFAFSAGVALILISLHFLIFYLMEGKPNGGYYFINHYVARIIYTIVVSPILYGFNRFLFKSLKD